MPQPADEPVVIRQVAGRGGMRAFHQYPFVRYADNKHWIPVPVLLEKDKTDVKHNPYYKRAQATFWLAYQHGKVAGRIGAIDDASHNAKYADNMAFFGFFEAADAVVAQALLTTAEQWARGRGRTGMRGPLSPSMDEGPGFQINAFDTPNFIMMPYTHEDYLGYVEANGYRGVKEVLAWYFDAAQNPRGAQIERVSLWIRKKFGDRLRVRDFNTRDFDNDIRLFQKMYHQAWQDNWGYVQRTTAEYKYMAAALRWVVEPRLAFIIMVDEEPVAVCLSLPDFNQVFTAMRGRLFPFGWLKFLRRRRYIDRCRVIALGTVPKWRNRGLEALIIHELEMRLKTVFGRSCAECSWVLEDNDGMNKAIAAAGCWEYKRYRIYEKTLTQ